MRETVSFEEKPIHPYLRANWLSVITFWYTFKTFVIGMKRPLVEGDVFEPLPAHKANLLGHKIARKWTEELNEAQSMKRKPKLMNALRKCFFGKLILPGLIIGTSEMLRLLIPVFVSLTVKYFVDTFNTTETVKQRVIWKLNQIWTFNEPITRMQLYFYSFGIVTFSLLPVLIFHPILFECSQIGMCIRIACCSLIYRKALRIDSKVIKGRAGSSAVNLLLQNLNKFDVFPLLFHYLWIGPLQIIIITIIFYEFLGSIALFAMLSFILIIPVNLILAMFLAKLENKSSLKSEERLNKMDEIVTGIEVIKMCNWENLFMKYVGNIRQKEMTIIRCQNYTKGFFMALIMFVTRGCIFLESSFHFLESSTISAESIFFVLAYFQILRQTMTIYFPMALTQVLEANMTIHTIDNFLNLEETLCGNTEPLHPQESIPHTKYKYHYALDNMQHPRARVILKNVFYKIGGRRCLNDISFTVLPSTLTIIVGPLGCGKSTLLKMILNEYQPEEGTIQTIGFVSYASENVWIFSASIRQNILFGLPFNRDRYMRVIDVCALGRDLTHVNREDRTLVGENGVSLSSGQRARIHLARTIYKDADIYLLDDPFSYLDSQISDYIYNGVRDFLKEKIVILTTHNLEYLADADQVIMMEEGQIYAIGTLNEIQEKFINSNNLTGLQQYINEQLLLKDDNPTKLIRTSSVAFEPMSREERRRRGSVDIIQGKVSNLIYFKYLRYFGNCTVLFIIFLLFVLAQGLGTSCDYFLSLWIRLQNPTYSDRFLHKTIARSTCLEIYSTLIILMVVVTLTRSIIFFECCKVASVKFHDAMLKSMMYTDLQFFYINSSDKILERFSKNIAIIDETLPLAIMDTLQFSLNLLGVVIILLIITPYMLIPTIICCCLVYFVRRIYINTSGSVASLESRLQTPLYSHMHATLLGLTTIRAHGGETVLVTEFDKYQDKHTSASFLLIMTNRAFCYWIDLICVLLIASVITTLIILSHFVTLRSEAVGLVITQCLGLFGLFQYGVRQSAILANNIASVQNVLDYINLKNEQTSDPENNQDLSDDWPQNGRIEFRNVNVKYDTSYQPVLFNINFTVESRQKIGIVGRTGAGKTSLILALFQLVKVEGMILIDDVDISTLNYEKFRRKISIITQEPILFCGTLRHNLDPFERFTNIDIYKALLLIEYKSAFSKGLGCLDDNISEGGANLSNGEKQLLCLARVILNRSRIIVLDEATANMDPVADEFIQTILSEKFSDCTVITVAHRLNVIMRYDKVLLIDGGKILEYDHPFILINKRNGVLASMIEHSGNASNLKRIAEMNYNRKMQIQNSANAPSTS